jgi:hypothetical protein
MGAEQLDELLQRMPAIAKAVNSFASEAVQQQAFDALVESLRTAASSQPSAKPHGAQTAATGTPRSPRKRTDARSSKSDGAASAGRKRAATKAPAMVIDLNLRPQGKKSFQEFVAEKAPSSQSEKNTVAVYYLKHELGVGKVSADHVFTAYREMKAEWKLPGDLRNSLQVTKSATGWLETSDMDDIKLTAAGTNTVEHDLPRKKK